MKLKMKQLREKLIPLLKDLGYIYFPHKLTWEGGLFCKKTSNEMYLSLGINIHRYYDCSFTIDMYYSKTTHLGATWGDIPKACYFRLSSLLNEEERKKLSLPISPYDIWWNSLSEDSLLSLIKAISLSEKKIQEDKILIRDINLSSTVSRLLETSRIIKDKVQKKKLRSFSSYQFIPIRRNDDVPLEWFMAAEEVLKNYISRLSKYGVISDAEEAFRQYILNENIVSK